MDDPDQLQTIARALELLAGQLDAAAAPKPEPVVRTTFAERVGYWQRALGPGRDASELRGLAAQFVIPEASVEAIVEAAEDTTFEALWRGSSEHARPGLATVAEPVEVRARIEDLVLPDAQLRMLESIALMLRNRVRVLYDWGFAERGVGPGLSAVFAGPSGTGKTMAAEALANAAKLDLYRVDLGAVIGVSVAETEAKLRRLFDAAEAAGAVLVFDDADALFGAGGSSARGVELELGYLIQRMEAYQGATIFTTSPRESFDSELLRRARFVIDFPRPPMELREKLWRRMLPDAVPREDLAFHKFSRLDLAGGTIRQIVLNAAYMAAEAGGPLTMSIMLEAVRLEYTKQARPLPESAIRGWA